MPNEKECPNCGGSAVFVDYCGCWVCTQCEKHLGRVRCYCGWSESGRNGRVEIQEIGIDTIDPEPEVGGGSWDDNFFDDPYSGCRW